MSDRLAELRRQRELVQQHLAWLDRELATETAKQNSAPVAASSRNLKTTATPTAAAPASVAPAVVTSAPTDADRILEEYRVSPMSLHRDVRKGCFLYFAAALAIVIAIVAILYVALSHR